MVFLLGLALTAIGAWNTTPGVLNTAPLLALSGIGIAAFGLWRLVSINSEDITETHPDALGSLDIREREGHQ